MVSQIPTINQDTIDVEDAICVSSDDSATSITDHIDIMETTVGLEGGQPKGTTDIIRKLVSDSVLTSKNDITNLYVIEKAKADANKVKNTHCN